MGVSGVYLYLSFRLPSCAPPTWTIDAFALHSQSIASKQRLLQTQLDDRVRGLTEQQIKQIKVHFTASITDFVKHYKMSSKLDLRQRVAATACVYFRRFYLKNCFCHVDPRLAFVGCIYLSSKVEESQLNAKHLVAFARKYRPQWSYDVKHILDFEMVLMEDLNFNLVVFSPYRALAIFLRDLDIGDDAGLRSWTILNDSYRTDVSLLHPPHMVALACIQIAAAHMAAAANSMPRELDTATCSLQQAPPLPSAGVSPPPAAAPHASLQAQQTSERLVEWMADLNVDLQQVYDIVLDITDLYELNLIPISVEECNRLLDSVQLQGATQALVPSQVPASQPGGPAGPSGTVYPVYKR